MNTQLTDSLSTLAQALPASARKQVYKTFKILGALATLVLLVLPALPGLGIDWTGTTVVATVATFVVANLGHLADSNTHPEPLLDASEAPEPTP